MQSSWSAAQCQPESLAFNEGEEGWRGAGKPSNGPRTAAALEWKQLSNGGTAVQEVAAHAGQVVTIPASDHASLVSGDNFRPGPRHGSSGVGDAEAGIGRTADISADGSDALQWKVEVVDVQVALLSASHLGTAQLVVDSCCVSQATLPASVKVEVRQ